MESYDSVTDQSEDGGPLKMMPVVDEYTSMPGIGGPAVLVSSRRMRKDPVSSVRLARENPPSFARTTVPSSSPKQYSGGRRPLGSRRPTSNQSLVGARLP